MSNSSASTFSFQGSLSRACPGSEASPQTVPEEDRVSQETDIEVDGAKTVVVEETIIRPSTTPTPATSSPAPRAVAEHSSSVVGTGAAGGMMMMNDGVVESSHVDQLLNPGVSNA